MKVSIEINNVSKSPARKQLFLSVAEETLRGSGLKFLTKKEISLSLALVPGEAMKKINKEFRKKNEVTDVLSFSEYRSTKEVERETSERIFLGEIILCYNYIADYAKKNSIDPKKELARVFSHGILHLLGFQHGKRMFSIQDKAINRKNL